VKSGYGLDTAAELKSLALIGQLADGAPNLVATFLGPRGACRASRRS